uniref:Uncharacterized protein n=1 Tax=Arundo donax TaxID=35708 RepID=A0A0A8Y820_ARUDO
METNINFFAYKLKCGKMNIANIKVSLLLMD